MKLRIIPLVGVISIVSLGLIGVGVHATFTTSTSSGEALSANWPDVTLTGSCINGTTCPVDNINNLYSLSPDGDTLTFATDIPAGISFTTGYEQVTATNSGGLPLTSPTWTPSVTVGTQLGLEAYVCVTSTGIGTGTIDYLLYNGPLSGFTGTTYSLADTLSTPGIGATATSGPTDNIVFDVYAGSEQTQCGTSFTNGTGISNGTGQSAGVGSTAASGVSEAPTLNGDTTGQSVAVNAEFTYQS
jgi:hypothetical protein